MQVFYQIIFDSSLWLMTHIAVLDLIRLCLVKNVEELRLIAWYDVFKLLGNVVFFHTHKIVVFGIYSKYQGAPAIEEIK